MLPCMLPSEPFQRSRIPKDLLYSFKKEVIPALLSTLADSTIYEPALFISEVEFIESQLYHAPDIYNGMDYIEGTAGKTHFCFSYVNAQDVQAERVTETDIHGNIRTRTETHRYTIFSGLFFSADCNKYFRSHTVVVPSSFSNKPILKQ